MKFWQKLVLLLFLGFLFTTPILARDDTDDWATRHRGEWSWYVQPSEIWQEKVFKGNPELMFKERFVLSITTDLMNSAVAAIGGVTTVAQGPNGPVYVHEGGAANIMANVVTQMTVGPPVSSVEYLADLGQNLGIVKPAYAQGIGFSAFSSVLNLWKIFRDIAYLGFVVIFIIVGFMIMFRKKIDPRTVVTIQDALPRIVVTLLLVTFSYAIAGIIVDFSELTTRLIANTLVNGTLLGVVNPRESINDLLSSDVFKLVNPLRNIDDIVGAIQATKIGGDVPSWLAGITVGVVFWIAGFFIMFKIFFALLGPYVAIILSVIFAPFQLLMGAIPGSTQGLTAWLKQIIANAAVFPVTFAMLAISAILQSGPTLNRCDPNLSLLGGPGGSALWCTPREEISLLWTPVGMNLGRAVGHLAGFGVLFTIPRLAELVKEMLEYKPSPITMVGAEEMKGALGRIPFVKSFVG